MFKVENLDYSYTGDKLVLKDINFELFERDFLSIIGPNGSGKTTLLKTVSKILNSNATITINNEDIAHMSRKKISENISYFAQLKGNIADLSVYDTVMLGRYPYITGFLGKPSKKDKDIVNSALEKTRLEDLRDTYTSRLSGGQLQRVFLAQIIAQDTKIILLDEPTNHLDLKHQKELLKYIKTYAYKHNKIVIGVFHDLSIARKYSNKILLLGNGEISSYDVTNKVFDTDMINELYGLDIKKYMIEHYKEWT